MDVVSNETRALIRSRPQSPTVQKFDSPKSELAACKTLARAKTQQTRSQATAPAGDHASHPGKSALIRRRRENPPKTSFTRTRTAPGTNLLELCYDRERAIPRSSPPSTGSTRRRRRTRGPPTTPRGASPTPWARRAPRRSSPVGSRGPRSSSGRRP